MGFGEYVCGLEPTNSLGNRKVLRDKGQLNYINPGEKIKCILEIGVIDSMEDVELFKADCI